MEKKAQANPVLQKGQENIAPKKLVMASASPQGFQAIPVAVAKNAKKKKEELEEQQLQVDASFSSESVAEGGEPIQLAANTMGASSEGVSATSAAGGEAHDSHSGAGLWWLGGLALAGAGVGIALGSSGGGSSTPDNGSAVALGGRVTDGPVVGATIYRDVNANGVYDAETDTLITHNGSPILTDENGDFEITNADLTANGISSLATLKLVAHGGTDTVTGEEVTVDFTAPAGYLYLNPITSMIAAYMEATGDGAAEAEAAIEAALGLPELDYATTDLYDQATAVDAQKVAAVLATAAIIVQATDLQAEDELIDDPFAYLVENIGTVEGEEEGATDQLIANLVSDLNKQGADGEELADLLQETVVAIEDSDSLDGIDTVLTNPLFISGITGTAAENAAANTVVYETVAADPNGDEVSYSLKGDGSTDDADLVDIDSVTGEVTLKASADYETKSSYSFTVIASDGDNETEQEVTINVTDVNEALSITSGATGSVAENAATTTVVYDAAAADPDAATTLTYSLSGTDATAFDIDSSTGEVTLKNSADYETKSSYSINVVASDGSLSDTEAVTINVTNVNEAPSITSGATGSVAENAATTTVVYDAAAGDPDAGTTLTYSLSGTDATAFDIDSSTGEVTLKNSADYETKSSYSINVVASDGSLSDTEAVTISIINANDNAPVLGDYTVSLAENSANATAFQTVAATDSDGSTISYSITAGNPGNAFAIDAATGAITVSDATKLDYETTTSFSLTVQASDGTATDTGTVTVNLTNANDNAPVLGDYTVSFAENSANATAVQTVAATDADGSTISYSFTAGNDDGAFAIDAATGAITVSDATKLDYETTTSFSLTVQASDGTATDTGTVTVNLANANDNVPVQGDYTVSLAENSANATAVQTVAATDADGSTISYSITAGNPGNAFAIDAATGAITVSDATKLDYETTTSFSLIVQASDGTATDTGTVTVNLTNANDNAPVLGDYTVSLAENSANATAVQTVAATDADGSTISYSLTAGNDDGAFAINATTGAITVADASKLDYETTTSFSLTVQASDGTATDTGTVTVNVTDDVNETDETAPAAPTLDLLAASDSGSEDDDDYTNDTTPTIRVTFNGSGATLPVSGDEVTLFVGATEVGSATLTSTDITAGYVDITTSELADDGEKVLTATVTDASDNTSAASDSLTITLDTVANQLQSGGSFVQLTGDDNPLAVVDEGAWAFPAVGDVNGDGLADIVVGTTLFDANNVGVAYYQQQEDGSFVKQEGDDNPFNSVQTPKFSFVALGDMDNDGDLDLVVGDGKLDTNTATVHYFENTGTTTAPTYLERTGEDNPFSGISITPTTTSPYAFIAAGDVDGDGRDDLVVTKPGNNFTYLKQTADGVFTEQIGDANPFGDLGIIDGFHIPYLADFNGDGATDFAAYAAYAQSAGITFYPGGTNNFALADTNPFADLQYSVPFATGGDVDSDGDGDFLIGDNGGVITFYQNNVSWAVSLDSSQVEELTADSCTTTVTENLLLKGMGTEPNAVIEIFVDGESLAEVTADEEGAWTYTWAGPLEAGSEYALTVQQTDLAGNVSELSSEVTLSVVEESGGDTIYVVVERTGAYLDSQEEGTLGVYDVGTDTLLDADDFQVEGAADLAANSVTIHFNDIPGDDGDGGGGQALNLTGFGTDDLIEFDVGAMIANGVLESRSDSITDIDVNTSNSVATNLQFSFTSATFTFRNVSGSATTFNGAAKSNVYRLSATDLATTIHSSGRAFAYWTDAGNALNDFFSNLVPDVHQSSASDTTVVSHINDGDYAATYGGVVDFIWPAAEPQDYDTYVVVERGGVFIDTDKDGVRDEDEDTVADFDGDDANVDLATQSVSIEFNDVPLSAIDLTGFTDDDKVAFDVGSFQEHGLMNSSSNSVTKFTFDNYPYFGFNNSTVWFTLIDQTSGSWHTSRNMKGFDSNTHSSAVGGLACSSMKIPVSGNTMGVVAFWTDAGNPLNNVSSIFVDYTSDGSVDAGAVVDAINDGSNTGLVDFILPTPQPEVYVVVTADGAYLDSDEDGIKDAEETTAAAFGNSANADLTANAVTIHFNAIPTTALDLAGFSGNDRIEVDLTAILNGVDISRGSSNIIGVKTNTPNPPATGWRSRWGSVNGNDVVTDYRSAMHVTDNGKLQLGSLATKPISAGRIGVPITGATFGLIDTIASNFDFDLLASNVDFVAASAPNYAPVITSNGGATQTISYAENDTVAVGETHALDTNGHLVTYELSGDDSALFNINARTGEVTWKVSPDFETPGDSGTNNVYDFTVTATDGALTDTQDYAVTVTDVDEIPVYVVVERDGAYIDNDGDGIKDNDDTVAAVFSAGGSADLAASVVTIQFNDFSPDALNLTGFTDNDKVLFDIGSLIDNGVFDNSALSEVNIASGRLRFGLSDSQHMYVMPYSANFQTLLQNVNAYNPTHHIHASAGAFMAGCSISNHTAWGAILYWNDDNNPLGNYTKLVPDWSAGWIAADYDQAVADFNAGDHGDLVDFIWPGAANQTPVITSSDGSPTISLNYDENAVTSVYDVDATDADNDTITYSLDGIYDIATHELVDDDSDLFQIDSEFGLVTWKNAPDFENPLDGTGDGGSNSYKFSVIATDSHGDSDTLEFQVAVVDVEEAAATKYVVVRDTGAWLDEDADGFHDLNETTEVLTAADNSAYFDANTVVMHFVDTPAAAINVNGFGTDDRIELAIDAPNVELLNKNTITYPHSASISLGVNEIAYNFTMNGNSGGIVRGGSDALVTWSNAGNQLLVPLFVDAGTMSDAAYIANLTNITGLVDFVAQPIPG